MKEVEDQQQQQQSQQTASRTAPGGGPDATGTTTPGAAGVGSSGSSGSSSNNKDRYLDLEGVTCEPTPARNKTLWNFRCDGATYPARLVNLPCPIELHKTHDHAMYYKCVDVAQMLIVYEDEMALEEAEFVSPEGFPSYYHSGITPPLRRVVEKRFAAREHGGRTIPPRAAIADVENELTELMENLVRDGKSGSHDKNGKGGNQQNQRKAAAHNKIPALTSATKVLEEVEEEIVDYEPWMDDYGRAPNGVEFDADDQLCSLHPEVWLSSGAVQEIRDESDRARREAEEAQAKKEAKKEAKKNKKWQKELAANESLTATGAAAGGALKKGIANKKNRAIVQQQRLDANSNNDNLDIVDILNDAEFDLDNADFLEEFGDENFDDLGMDFDT